MKKPKPQCGESGCERVSFSKGLCGLHYQRKRNAALLTDEDRERRAAGKSAPPECAESECNKSGVRRGYCHAHYMQRRRLGIWDGPLPAKQVAPALELVGITPSEYAREKGISRARVEQLMHPEKHRARMILAYALKIGKLIRPENCEDCGAACRPHGHHSDYSKPLQVEWLCSGCHGKRHADGSRVKFPAFARKINKIRPGLYEAERDGEMAVIRLVPDAPFKEKWQVQIGTGEIEKMTWCGQAKDFAYRWLRADRVRCDEHATDSRPSLAA